MPLTYSWDLPKGGGAFVGSAPSWNLGLSGRLITNNGSPFFVHGDTAWALAVQLTQAQVDTYLQTRASQGFTAVLFSAIEAYYSSQAPAYQSVGGFNPFGTMTDFASSMVSGYWSHVDYIVNKAASLGMICLIFPAYSGLNAFEGWQDQFNAETDADLQTYGAALASRYTQGNVIWCLGGDSATSATKQWNIVTGMRTVRTSDLITAHASRSNDPYATWNGLAGWNLNNIYCAGDGNNAYSLAETAYGRSGPLPFFLSEGGYEGERTAQQVRRAAYTSLLSGACGHFFGNNPIWGFGEANANGGGGAANALSTSLSTTGATEMGYLKTLFTSYSWNSLVPKTDTSLVSSSLGTGTARICPALASGGSFAMIYVQAAETVTVVMSALSPSSVRARTFNPTTGAYSAVSGSPFSNSGTQNITTPGECVIVLDAA